MTANFRARANSVREGGGKQHRPRGGGSKANIRVRHAHDAGAVQNVSDGFDSSFVHFILFLLFLFSCPTRPLHAPGVDIRSPTSRSPCRRLPPPPFPLPLPRAWSSAAIYCPSFGSSGVVVVSGSAALYTRSIRKGIILKGIGCCWGAVACPC